jgi:DNA-binding transcriptional LysR family regulator
MVAEGRVDAALVSMPIAEPDLFVQSVCSEELLVCLRADDPVAQEQRIPRAAIKDRLNIFFDRMHHPLLYEQLMRKFAIPQTFCPCRSGIRDSLSLAPALRAESSLSR